MRRFLLLACLIAFFAGKSSAQAFRFESQVSQEANLLGIPVPVLTIPSGPIVTVCNFPANAVPCTNKATTFTNISQVFPCSNSTQIVLAGTSTCVSNTDQQGNWGIWVAPGVTYSYTISVNGQNLGPFSFTAGGAGGGGSGSANLMVVFSGVTSATLNAASLNTANLIPYCWDNSAPNANPVGFNASLNLLTLVVTFGFAVPQSGYCVVNGSGGGGGGGATGAVLQVPIINQSIVQPPGTSFSMTAPGIFTNTQDNQPYSANINSFSWSASDPFFLSDAFASAIEVPGSSTVTQADGLSGGCETQSTATNCVGLFGIGLSRVNAGNAWGINTIVNDKDSLGVVHTGVKSTGYEDDIGCHDVTTVCFGMLVIGAVGNVSPAIGGAVRVASLGNFSTVPQWPYIFGSDPGISTNFAIVNNACAGGITTCPSQQFQFFGNNAGTGSTSILRTSAIGSFEFAPQSGSGITMGSLNDPRGEQEIDTPGAHVPDALNIDVAHGINFSSVTPAVIDLIVGQRADQATFMTYLQGRNNYGVNNTAYPIQLNPLGGNVGINNGTAIPGTALDVVGTVRATSLTITDEGSCTMTAGTCSAQALSHTYTGAAKCFVSWNGGGTLTGILKIPATSTNTTPASSINTDTAVVNWFCTGN